MIKTSSGQYVQLPNNPIENEHATLWLRPNQPTKHPRELHLPIFAVIEDDVVLLQDRRGAIPTVPTVVLCSFNHPDPQPTNGWSIIENERYVTSTHLVNRFVSEHLMPDVDRREVVAGFIGCYKAKPIDLPERTRFVGPAALSTAKTMVDVKQIPFTVELDGDQTLAETYEGQHIRRMNIDLVLDQIEHIAQTSNLPEGLGEMEQLLRKINKFRDCRV